MKEIKPLALYLPQYHPTEINDKWWGKGFTEWTNVTKAKPLFEGHQQPLLAGELGYYDLRVPEIREQQATLAKEHGIYGFIYYHYWFGNGKQILERIANEVLTSGKPDFPFCFCWANETWSGRWHGLDQEIIAEQTYPHGDVKLHFEYLLPFFKDDRYIKIDGKPVFIVYDAIDLEEKNNAYLSELRKLAKESGFEDLYFIAGNKTTDDCDYQNLGYVGKISSAFKDAWVTEINKQQHKLARESNKMSSFEYYKKRILGILNSKSKEEVFKVNPSVNQQDMNNIVDRLEFKETNVETYPCIMPNWDNTPRSGYNGIVVYNATVENFKKQIDKAVQYLNKQNYDENFLVIKSWNEWAEGNILEPDKEKGRSFLETLKKTLYNS